MTKGCHSARAANAYLSYLGRAVHLLVAIDRILYTERERMSKGRCKYVFYVFRTKKDVSFSQNLQEPWRNVGFLFFFDDESHHLFRLK